MLTKHSLTISGHVTSVSLEDIFWQTLKEIAQKHGYSLSTLIAEIDATREGNLSSAIRVFVLQWALAQRQKSL